MRHMHEMFISSGEDWMTSSLVMNARRRNGRKKQGTYIWVKYAALEAQLLN